MQTVTSAAFSGDMALKVEGDPSKMTDPTSKALLSQGVAFHMEGKSQNDPVAADVKMSLGLAGQTIDLGMLAQDTKVWVEYQGQWYAVDQKSAEGLGAQAKLGAAPTQQLKSLGLDPSQWGTTYTMVGAEDLDGTQVYHVKATVDPLKLAAALLKAANDPSLAKKLGASSQLKQLEQSLTQNKKQADQLKKSLKNTSVDYWIGVDDQLIHKAEFAASLSTTGQKGMQGVSGLTVMMTVAMSDFNKPVTVTPPASALPFKDLMNQMLGGMMTGASSSGVSY